MAGGSGDMNEILDGYDERSTLSLLPQKSNALANRLTSVLSASYADPEIRDALRTLDGKNTQNNIETRRALRLDVQKEVINCDGEIVKEFGNVAEVCSI